MVAIAGCQQEEQHRVPQGTHYALYLSINLHYRIELRKTVIRREYQRRKNDKDKTSNDSRRHTKRDNKGKETMWMKHTSLLKALHHTTAGLDYQRRENNDSINSGNEAHDKNQGEQRDEPANPLAYIHHSIDDQLLAVVLHAQRLRVDACACHCVACAQGAASVLLRVTGHHKQVCSPCSSSLVHTKHNSTYNITTLYSPFIYLHSFSLFFFFLLLFDARWQTQWWGPHTSQGPS